MTGIHLHLRRVFHGPNPYAMEPVVLVDWQCDADMWHRMHAGIDSMREHWPDWMVRQSAGSLHDEALEDARLLVAWARGALNAVRGLVTSAGAARTAEGGIQVWLGYHVQALTVQALRLAAEAALALSDAHAVEGALHAIRTSLDRFWQATRSQHPDYQIRFVMLAAREHDVPVLPLVQTARVWQTGWGRRQRLFLESTPSENSVIGGMLSRDKVLSKQFLAALGAPIAPHVLVSERAQLADAVQRVGWPCAVKPLNLNGGKGVTADVRTMDALEAAYDYARRFTAEPIMVERHVHGQEHRLLLANGRLVWVVRRTAATLTGDGTRTVRALIDQINARRRAEEPDNQGLKPVMEDDTFHRHLASQGMTLQSVPAPGLRVTMRSVSNLSMGGELMFVTDRVHPSVRAMAESISAASGLSTIGLDYITEDIGADWQRGRSAFIEFNVTPGLDGVELHPGGEPLRLLCDALLGDTVGRIPVVCLWMTQTDWPQYQPQLQSWMQEQDRDWGGSGPGWLWANGLQWQAEGAPAHETAHKMLHHRSVARAVMVVVSEEVVRWGLPVDGVESLLVVNDAVPDDWQGVADQMACQLEAVSGLQALHTRLMQWSQASQVAD